jgi:competence protein ComEA
MPLLDRRTLLLGLAAILLLAATVTFIRGRGGDARPPAPVSVAAVTADGAGGVVPPAEEQLVVYVTGAVRRPGVYQLPDGKRIIDAIEQAGGVTPKADAVTVNLAALLIDGQQILVPEAFAPGAGAAPTGAGPATVGLVHLNSADVAALDALPGVGPATAQRIVDWREQNGGFRTVDDLEQVPGIGPAKLDALRDLVAP